jgi:NADH:ubiquinone oxidoreductase subunit 4 (subunit M)
MSRCSGSVCAVRRGAAPFIPRFQGGYRTLAVAVTGVVALLALNLLAGFDARWDPAVIGSCSASQVDSLGISLSLGVDGVNLGLVTMGAIVAFTAACVSWEIQSGPGNSIFSVTSRAESQAPSFRWTSSSSTSSTSSPWSRRSS